MAKKSYTSASVIEIGRRTVKPGDTIMLDAADAACYIEAGMLFETPKKEVKPASAAEADEALKTKVEELGMLLEAKTQENAGLNKLLVERDAEIAALKEAIKTANEAAKEPAKSEKA